MPEVQEQYDQDTSPTNLRTAPFQRVRFYGPVGNIHWHIIAGNVMQMKNQRMFLALVGKKAGQ